MTDSGDRITQDALIDSIPEFELTDDELQVEVDRKIARLRSTFAEFEDVVVSTDSRSGLQGVAVVIDRVLDAFNEF